MGFFSRLSNAQLFISLMTFSYSQNFQNLSLHRQSDFLFSASLSEAFAMASWIVG